MHAKTRENEEKFFKKRIGSFRTTAAPLGGRAAVCGVYAASQSVGRSNALKIELESLYKSIYIVYLKKYNRCSCR